MRIAPANAPWKKGQWHEGPPVHHGEYIQRLRSHFRGFRCQYAKSEYVFFADPHMVTQRVEVFSPTAYVWRPLFTPPTP